MQRYWYAALQSRVGMRFATPDPKAARAELYRSRRVAADPLLDDLKVLLREGEVWIVHKNFCTGNKLNHEQARKALEEGDSAHLRGPKNQS